MQRKKAEKTKQTIPGWFFEDSGASATFAGSGWFFTEAAAAGSESHRAHKFPHNKQELREEVELEVELLKGTMRLASAAAREEAAHDVQVLRQRGEAAATPSCCLCPPLMSAHPLYPPLISTQVLRERGEAAAKLLQEDVAALKEEPLRRGVQQRGLWGGLRHLGRRLACPCRACLPPDKQRQIHALEEELQRTHRHDDELVPPSRCCPLLPLANRFYHAAIVRTLPPARCPATRPLPYRLAAACERAVANSRWSLVAWVDGGRFTTWRPRWSRSTRPRPYNVASI